MLHIVQLFPLCISSVYTYILHFLFYIDYIKYTDSNSNFDFFAFQEPSEDLISQELTNPPEAIREEVVETQHSNPVENVVTTGTGNNQNIISESVDVVVADDEKFREINNDNNDSSSTSSSSSSSSSGSDSDEHSDIVQHPNIPAAESGPDPDHPEEEKLESNAGNGNDEEEVPDSQEISSNQEIAS